MRFQRAANGRVVGHLAQRLVQGLHYGLGRVFVHKVARPGFKHKAFEGRAFVQCGVFLDEFLALQGQSGHHLELAIFGQLNGALAVRRHENINRAAHQVLLRGCSAFVGHVRHFNTRELGHVLTQQVVHGAGAYAGVGHGLAGCCRLAGIGHQFVAIVGRQVFAGKHGQRVDGDHLHQAEVFALVLDGRIGQRSQHQFVGRTLENHVAFRGAVQHFLRRNAATGTPQVLHNHRLSELFGQRRVQGAGNHVRQAARRVGHHQGHGFAGKALGQG